MSTQYDDEYDEQGDEEQETTPDPKEQAREAYKIRKAEKEAKEAKEALEAMKRERAFEKAGIDPENPKFSYFVKGYDGDLTSEAVKAEAIKVGLIEEEKTPEPGEQPEVQAQQRIAAAATGGTVADKGVEATWGAVVEAYNSGDGDNTIAALQELARLGFPIADSG